ncbi:MAG: gluconate 2-dehydrogenase subunit 3 family protein [Myxococcales bacterium]
MVQIVHHDDDYVLARCSKYLARDYAADARHGYGPFPETDLRARICEAWRFPVVDAFTGEGALQDTYGQNEVTFVYFDPRRPAPGRVEVIGTFADLYQPVPLRRLRDDLPYYAVTVAVPKGEVHTYKFRADGDLVPDPINPQRVVLDNGSEWSRFFTEGCTAPITFERWEREILLRLTSHILPFHTPDGQRFLDRYYEQLDRRSRDEKLPTAYRFDTSVGVVNFIDKVLAREEIHHRKAYKTCLAIIDKVLRARDPFQEPAVMPRDMFVDLYTQMGVRPDGMVPEWDLQQYARPRYFLELLRRHTLTGAYSHPKYGGNAGAAGWAYLEERYRDANGRTQFDWRVNQERPLGESADYRG